MTLPWKHVKTFCCNHFIYFILFIFKERGVRMVAFDKFEDVIKIIREGLYKELLDMAKSNYKPEKKKKKNKWGNSNSYYLWMKKQMSHNFLQLSS